MIQSVRRMCCVLSVTLAASLAFAQAEFSADIVDLHKSGAPTLAKIYFAKDKMRIEAQKSGAQSGAIVVNFATQTSTILMDQQHMYMEIASKTQGQEMGYGASFFRTGDVENACGDWQKTTQTQGGTCRKVGNDLVSGRNTVKYETTSASGELGHFWLDPALRFPVKWQGKSSEGELRNIHEGAQPASLFEVPTGYTKMDMGGMMQHH